jgi:MFS family permease
MGAYSAILRSHNMAPLFAATLLARLPIGINGLATVLFLRRETGSFAVAGATAGAIALGSGIGAPVAARLIDAFGKRVLLVLAAAHAAGLGSLIALGFAKAPAPALVAAGLLTGIALPPISSVMRALYPRMLRDPALVQGAYALDSVSTEMLFIAGPLVTGGLVALGQPAIALGVSAAAVAIGAVVFLAALPESERHARAGDSRRSRLGALRAPGIRTLVAAMVPVGFAIGSLQVALPAFADSHHGPAMAGVFMAIWSIASGAGGLIYGARERRSPLAHTHIRVALIVPLAFVPLTLAWSIPAMAVLVAPAGLFIAPLIATRNELVGMVAPIGSETEAFTWPLTALIAGLSVGAGVAGSLVDEIGWRAPAIAAVAAAALGAAVAVTRRATLGEREPEPEPVPAA